MVPEKLVVEAPEPVLRLSNVVEVAPAVEAPPLLLTQVASGAATPDQPPDVWNGAALRRAREVRGLTLGKLADTTKVARHHLEAIEGDTYARLPSYVYLRGILLTVAKELRLDPHQVCRSYLDAARQSIGDAP